MFTGIIKTMGRVVALDRKQDTAMITIATPLTHEIHSQVGESIAINGICLTITALSPQGFSAEVMPETMRRTNLGTLQLQSKVNLEPALRATDRLDGHFVLGHVDTTAQVIRRIVDQNALTLTFQIDPAQRAAIVEKGSVAIDGVSLTVTAVSADTFSVSLIPATQQATTLGQLQLGDDSNIETDILGKYILAREAV
ncbi:riboflavin synthase [Lacticaseibacillus saniviri]